MRPPLQNYFLPKNSLDVYLINFLFEEKNVMFSRYLDFSVFVKSTDFKICDVITGIGAQ